MLQAHNISKVVEGKTLLDNVSLTAEPGTVTAILGPNGAGKSVLLRALALVDPPTDGEIAYDGETTTFPVSSHRDFTDLWPDVNLVFQQLHLWPHRTLRDNILMPLRYRSNGMARDAIEHLVETFDLQSAITRYPNQASLGQRQLVALVRALALRPKWLLLDEATSALDMEQTDRLLRVLADLKTEGQVTLILVTHWLGMARQIADQVVFLDSGRQLETGSSSILTAPASERFAQFLRLSEATTDLHRPASLEQSDA